MQLEVVRKHRGRVAAFALSFAAGLTLAAALRVAFVTSHRRSETRATNAARPQSRCARGETFDSPEEVYESLGSADVGVRREAFRRLFVLPGLATAYYDFERDSDFPERAESLKLRRVNLDDAPDDEALITFVRVDSPVAIVLKRDACGWKAVAAISSWLRFEDYPYADWVETPEAFGPGRHLLVVRDSTGDATRYTRRARLLRLVGGHLEEAAEIEEEAIGPVEGYAGDDWARVKRRRTAAFRFAPPDANSPARMSVEYRDEVVRYSGVEPLNVYWREGDGVWHEARRHWRTRRSESLRPAVVKEEQFVWSEQKNRFVPAAS
jgi:hypothetical protein